MVENKDIGRLGELSSIFVGVSYILISLTYFILPKEQLSTEGEAFGTFLESLAKSSYVFKLQMWLFALGSMFAIASVLAIYNYFKHLNPAWIHWTSYLAIIGFSIIMIMSFSTQIYIPELAKRYVTSSESVQSVIKTRGFGFNDWMGFSLIGFWMTVVNILGFKNKIWPKFLCFVGFTCGLSYLLVGVGLMLSLSVLISISAGISGFLLAPIWYIIVGVLFKKG